MSVGALHQAEADESVPQAVEGAGPFFAVMLETKLDQDYVKHRMVRLGEDLVGRLWLVALLQALKYRQGILRALAGATMSAKGHFRRFQLRL